MIEVLPAKNGSVTARVSGVFLHSQFNPENEAQKYINSLTLPDNVSCFILIECVFGFIIPILKKQFPRAQIISLHCTEELKNNSSAIKSGADFYFENNDLYNYLEKEISLDAEIKIIEWRPALSVYKNKYLSLLETVVKFIEFNEANKRASIFFEKRWNKNAARNIRLIKNIVTPKKKIDVPVVVIASGRSLASTMPIIRRLQEKVYIIAVSSALSFLYQNDIFPDIVISIDGGFWATLHLFSIYRFCPKEKMPILSFSLNAALPTFLKNIRAIPISFGTKTHTELFNNNNMPHITLPERGTVSASAIDLAFALSEKDVYITGIDLSVSDIITHVSPHAFEALFYKSSTRFNPYYSTIFERSRKTKEAGSLDMYALWFKNNLSLYKGRLVSLVSNNSVFDIPVRDTIETADLKENIFFSPAAR